MRQTIPGLMVCVVLAGGASSEAGAQEVHGTLIAAETGTILPYGTVELLDNNLRPVATAYGDELARFALVAPGPGGTPSVATT